MGLLTLQDLETAILGVLDNRKSAKLENLETLVMQAQSSPIDLGEFRLALDALSAQQLVAISGSEVRRSNPDFPERVLEKPIEAYLASKQAYEVLKLDRELSVLQRTATGGRSGTGIWSRPDFTIATIRRRKYDPMAHLDVLAFELKNLAGSSVVAVHEALAHTRFAHYAYVVCPRSSANTNVHEAIEQACSEYGIGLITFLLNVDRSEQPKLTEFKIEVSPRRQSPDPEEVDNYIDNRLDELNQERLLQLAQG